MKELKLLMNPSPQYRYETIDKETWTGHLCNIPLFLALVPGLTVLLCACVLIRSCDLIRILWTRKILEFNI